MSSHRNIGRTLADAAALTLHGRFDTSTELGRSKERLRRIALTALTAAIAKALSMAVPLVTISLVLPYLGREVYGLWMTVIGLFAMLGFADLGLGSGLITKLSTAYGNEAIEESRSLTSSCFFLLLVVACVLLLLFCTLFSVIPWSRLVNAETEAVAHLSALVVTAVFLPQILQLPFAMVQRTQLALQEGYLTNLWQCAASLASLAFVILAVRLDLGHLFLIGAVASTPALGFLLNWCWFFVRRHRSLLPHWSAIRRSTVLSLLRIGAGYSVLSGFLVFHRTIDDIIVAHVCGLAEVATFSVVGRVSTMVNTLVYVITLSFWAANGEALARGDKAWVRHNAMRMSLLATSLVSLGGAIFVLFGPWAIESWLEGSIRPSRWLLLAFACRESTFAFITPFIMVLNGAGKVWQQICVYVAYAPVSLVLKVLLAHSYGDVAVPWGAVLSWWMIVVPAMCWLAGKVYDDRVAEGGV